MTAVSPKTIGTFHLHEEKERALTRSPKYPDYLYVTNGYQVSILVKDKKLPIQTYDLEYAAPKMLLRIVNDRLVVAPIGFKTMDIFKITEKGALLQLVRRVLLSWPLKNVHVLNAKFVLCSHSEGYMTTHSLSSSVKHQR